MLFLLARVVQMKADEMPTILDAGANSVVYKENIEGKDFIIKICRNPDVYEGWLFCAAKENKMLSMLSKKRDFSADVPIMEIVNDSGQFKIVQSMIDGEFLTKDIYEKCSPEEKGKIAFDLAEAMYAIHNLNIEEIAAVTNDGYIPQESPERSNTDKYFKRNYTKLIETLGEMIPSETNICIDSFLQNNFNQLENVNKHVAPIHNDIRFSNIFYNQDNNKIGIIDFGSCEVGDLYHDFASIALPNSLGVELQENVINHYNQFLIRDNKGYQISPEAAKIYSVARMVYYSNMMKTSMKVRKTLFPDSNEDQIIGMEDYLAEMGVVSPKIRENTIQGNIDLLIDSYSEKISCGLPEWNYVGAENDFEIQKQKNNFLRRMESLKEKGIVEEIIALRAIDYCIAKYVPDEHVSIRIKGEDRRAGYAIIAKDATLAYKIPPTENNNLIVLNSEDFVKSELFTLTTPSDKNIQSNILVATKIQNNQRIGVIAVDSFMIEMGSEKIRTQVGQIADYVLEQSKKWDSIIFDFRGNGGGDATIVKEIGERLSGKKLKYADYIEVINAKLDEPTGAPDFYPQKSDDKTFSGDVYVLQDGGNASATEGAIWMLRQIDSCTTIGENTHGAFTGGDVKQHTMGNNAVLMLGNTYRERTMPDGTKVEEGKGIPADINCQSSDAYNKCLTLINNNQRALIYTKMKEFGGRK